MGAIGQHNFLVQLLKAKTKVKAQDIVDILKALPECMAEAFLEAAPDEKKPVYFGANKVHWKQTGLGPAIAFSATESFKNRINRDKIEKTYPFSAKLWDLSLPIQQKNMQEKYDKGRYAKDYVPPKYARPSAETPIEKAENRRILREKRKKQAIILKKAID